MSTRRTPEELSDQLSDLEEQVRRLQASIATTPTDVRNLFDARGDIIVALEDNEPRRLGRGAPGTALFSDPDAALGLAWAAIDALRESLLSGKGYLVVGDGSGGAALPPDAPDGSVLTLMAGDPLGMRWGASAESDAETLAWLAMSMAS